MKKKSLSLWQILAQFLLPNDSLPWPSGDWAPLQIKIIALSQCYIEVSCNTTSCNVSQSCWAKTSAAQLFHRLIGRLIDRGPLCKGRCVDLTARRHMATNNTQQFFCNQELNWKSSKEKNHPWNKGNNILQRPLVYQIVTIFCKDNFWSYVW